MKKLLAGVVMMVMAAPVFAVGPGCFTPSGDPAVCIGATGAALPTLAVGAVILSLSHKSPASNFVTVAVHKKGDNLLHHPTLTTYEAHKADYTK